MISILMPIKNESKFIKDCLNSIIAQTYQNYELIIVDDHSTDNSIEIIKSFQNNQTQANGSRIKLFQNPGNGIIDAINYAYTQSCGEYITRQDGDDLMVPKKLEILSNLLKIQNKQIIVTGKVKYFSEFKEGLRDGFLKYQDWINEMCDRENHYQNIFKECVLVSSNWLIRRELFAQVGGFKDLKYPEDYDFCFRLFEKNIKIISSNQITHLWRDHENRASRTLPCYKDQSFFDLKIKYFKKLIHKENTILWGAGPSGKKLAKILIKEHIEFLWITNNKNKIGKKIYDQEIFDFSILEMNKRSNLIISIKQKNAVSEIINYLNEINFDKYYEF